MPKENIPPIIEAVTKMIQTIALIAFSCKQFTLNTNPTIQAENSHTLAVILDVHSVSS